MNAWRWSLMTLFAAAVLLGSPALAAEAAHGEDPQLIDTRIGTIVGNAFVTLIVFVVVITVLGKFAWKPILNVLHERERTIRDSLESAKSEREQAEQVLAEYKAQLEQARQEAAALVDQGRRDAETVRRGILDEARGETVEMTERARREIELATDSAIKELYDRTADLSIDIAAQIIGKELSAVDHSRLIEDSIAAIRSGGKSKLN